MSAVFVQTIVPVHKKGSAIVCAGCKSTVFVPSDTTNDEDSEDGYGLSADWEEPPKRSVPVYPTDEEMLPIREQTDDEDTVREPPEDEEEDEEEEGYHRADLPRTHVGPACLGFLVTKRRLCSPSAWR